MLKIKLMFILVNIVDTFKNVNYVKFETNVTERPVFVSTVPELSSVYWIFADVFPIRKIILQL
jgi:hypothetical protein